MPTDRELIAHLFRRAGFGASATDLSTYASGTYAAAVEALVNPPSSARDRSMANVPTNDMAVAAEPNLVTLQDNWTRSMVTTTAPLEERMVLFLSNLFSVAYADVEVDGIALQRQQATIRKYALGNFSQLAHAMIDDHAVGCYLNNDVNMKAAPNENLARELMELFLLGPGAYSETDVKEVARALTGYRLKQNQLGGRYHYVFDTTYHDDTPKTILGKTDNFSPHTLIDHLLAQPAAPRFLATKLVTTFVSPTPDATLVNAVAQSLSGWDLPTALRTLFTSSAFQSEAVRHSLAKTPAEHIVGIMRGLLRTEYTYAHNYMSAAGMTLFEPPSVAGFPTGKRMLGPGGLIARYNAAVDLGALHAHKANKGAPSGTTLPPLIAAFGMASISSATQAAIDSYTNAAASQSNATRIAGVIAILTSSPDYLLS